MSSSRVVVSGFATIDSVLHPAQQFDGCGTVAIGVTAWDRAGGAVLYAGRELARAGLDVQALSWVGADPDGARWRAQCAEAGIGVDFVATCAATMRCVLLQQPDGTVGCLLQPFAGGLDGTQLAALDRASLLVVAAGDVAATARMLDHMPGDALLAWIAKADAACFPDALAARLAARADVVFCNQHERPWLDRFVPHAAARLLFETRGAAGVQIEGAGAPLRCAAQPIAATDATGAGDTFAGAVLAHLLRGVAPADAAQAGIAAAAGLLRSRTGATIAR